MHRRLPIATGDMVVHRPQTVRIATTPSIVVGLNESFIPCMVSCFIVAQPSGQMYRSQPAAPASQSNYYSHPGSASAGYSQGPYVQQPATNPREYSQPYAYPQNAHNPSPSYRPATSATPSPPAPATWTPPHPPVTQPETFRCDHEGCSESFSRRHDMRRHADSVHGTTRFYCEKCGKGFTRADSRQRHLKDNRCT